MRKLFLLNRLLIRELSMSLVAGLGVYSLLFLIQNLFVLSEIIIEKHAPFHLSVSFVALYFPKIVTSVFPFSVLFAASLVMARWVGSSELIALNAAGQPVSRQLRPFVGLGLAAGVVYVLASFCWVPASKVERDKVYDSIVRHAITAGIEPGVVQELAPGMYLRALGKPSLHQLEDVLLVNWGKPGASAETDPSPMITIADEARILPVGRHHASLRVQLVHGRDLTVEARKNGEHGLRELAFQSKTITIPIGISSEGETARSGPGTGAGKLSELNKLPFASFMEKVLSLNKGAVAILLRRLLMLLFVITAPVLGFAISFRLQRGAGVSGAFLSSFLIGLLFVVFAKLVESVSSRMNMTAGFGLALLICCIYLYILRNYHEKLKVLGLAKRKGHRSTLNTLRKRVNRLYYIWIAYFDRGSDSRSKVLVHYIRETVLRSVALAGTVLILMFVVLSGFKYLPDAFEGTLGWAELGVYLGWFTIATLPYTVPLIFLLGSLAAIGTLDARSEITALKASGVSIFALFRPVVTLSVVFVAGLLLMNNYLAPVAHRNMNRAIGVDEEAPVETEKRGMHIYKKDPSIMVLAPSGIGPENRVPLVYACRWNPEQDVLDWLVRMVPMDGEQRASGSLPQSRRAAATFAYAWLKPAPDAEKEVRELALNPTAFPGTVFHTEALTSVGLRKVISERKQIGARPYGLITAYYARFADALTPLILLLLGGPMLFLRSGRGRQAATGIATALLLTIAYYTGAAVFQSLGSVHYLPPFLAAWSMNILFGILGLLFSTAVRT